MSSLFRNLAGLALCAVAGAGQGAVIQLDLNPVADTTITSVAPDNNLGGDTFFNAGTAANGGISRGLLRFDIAGALPADAIVTWAQLTLEVVRQPQSPVDSSFSLYRMLAGWGEGSRVSVGNHPGLGVAALAGEATWNDRFALASQAWTTPGGAANVDYSTAISSEAYVSDLANSPYLFPTTPQMVGDVQAWLQHPELNYGWMLASQSEDTRSTARSFGSREGGFVPVLSIEYMSVPEPATYVLLLLGLPAVWSLSRRSAVSEPAQKKK